MMVADDEHIRVKWNSILIRRLYQEKCAVLWYHWIIFCEDIALRAWRLCRSKNISAPFNMWLLAYMLRYYLEKLLSMALYRLSLSGLFRLGVHICRRYHGIGWPIPDLHWHDRTLGCSHTLLWVSNKYIVPLSSARLRSKSWINSLHVGVICSIVRS